MSNDLTRAQMGYDTADPTDPTTEADIERDEAEARHAMLLDELQDAAARLEDERDIAQGERDEARKLFEAANEQAVALAETCAALRRNARRLESARGDACDLLAGARAERDAAAAGNTELRADVQRLTARLEELQVERDAARARANDALTALHALVATLTRGGVVLPALTAAKAVLENTGAYRVTCIQQLEKAVAATKSGNGAIDEAAPALQNVLDGLLARDAAVPWQLQVEVTRGRSKPRRWTASFSLWDGVEWLDFESLDGVRAYAAATPQARLDEAVAAAAQAGGVR
jgi:seryl-tRNA synthetase